MMGIFLCVNVQVIISGPVTISEKVDITKCCTKVSFLIPYLEVGLV